VRELVGESTPTIDGRAEVPALGPPADPTPAKADGWRRLRRVATAATLVAGLAWALHGVDARTLWAAVKASRPGWLLFAAVLNQGAIVLQAARWLALVRPLSPSATLGAAFKSMVVGTTVSMFVPARAGELARVAWFSRSTGLPRGQLLGSVLLDYLINAAGLLLGLGLLPFVMAVPPWIGRGIVLTVALFTVGALVVVAARPGAEATSASTGGGFVHRIAAALIHVRQGLVATSHPSALAASFTACVASWILELDVIAATMKAMGLEMPLAAGLLVLLAVNVALAFPFAPPANLGTLEFGASVALMGFGVSKEKAVAFGIVYHLLQIVPIMILGALIAGRGAWRPPADELPVP